SASDPRESRARAEGPGGAGGRSGAKGRSALAVARPRTEDQPVADCVGVLLGREPSKAVVRLWSEIEQRWGVKRTHPDAQPHLSLAVVLGSPPAPALSSVVAAVAGR